ncbi:hypothetical protein CcrMagneto_gp292 [Caulobacter virus Magneto]|uniref:hypothetical protein n=1 Tax=Caulobacter virus Magneto TaxID=1211642 RepID=UPI00028B6907|nr:hypothetical protein CcrMagneto_gp292 [Caulobacter virus Magneto]AFU87462.1 hypothetical protein CcrMagneto_gp292 [Caulobacter virus Magneto]
MSGGLHMRRIDHPPGHELHGVTEREFEWFGKSYHVRKESGAVRVWVRKKRGSHYRFLARDSVIAACVRQASGLFQ